MEGRGPATIHDVTLSKTKPPPPPTTSPRLSSLLTSLTETTKSLARAQKSLDALSTYLSTLDAQSTESAQLQSILDAYESTAASLDDKVTRLEKEKQRLDREVKEEKAALAGPKGNVKLGLEATIAVFAEFEGEVEITIIYGSSTLFQIASGIKCTIHLFLSFDQRNLVCAVRYPRLDGHERETCYSYL